jgi:hypothetical protein
MTLVSLRPFAVPTLPPGIAVTIARGALAPASAASPGIATNAKGKR